MFKHLGHLLCFVLPCTSLFFLGSGPHGAGTAVAWTLPLWLLVIADWFSPKIKAQQPYPEFSDRYFSAILYSLAVIQLCNIGLMLNYVNGLSWNSEEQVLTGLVNLIAIRILVGTSSGSSGFIVAHELIHRNRPQLRLLGNLLLCSMCYQHFAISHRQGHHRSVAKPDDIATARSNEDLQHYWKRVFFGHLLFAWQSEQKRLNLSAHRLRITTIIKNQVLLGLLFELTLLLCFIFWFGWIAALLFLYQSFTAIRLLETINYFQHWGLGAKAEGGSLAWVNDSLITRYALLNLSCHIDHHRNAGRHFQRLHYCSHGPTMPYGYFVTNLWAKLHNSSFRKRALRELEKYHKPQPVLAPSYNPLIQR